MAGFSQDEKTHKQDGLYAERDCQGWRILTEKI